MTSLIDVTKPVTGSPTTQSVRDNFATAKAEIEALQASVAGLIGMGKNCLINPNFAINQRAVSGTVTLAAGAYGHDRWKAGSLGCTYTFSSVNGITTLNISAGSLQQVIEAGNIPVGSNACTLSWSGTAQGKIGGGAYTATKVTATVTGGSNLTVEFNIGTLSLVQFEKGSNPTLYEQRTISAELALCQYYFKVIKTVVSMVVATGTLVSTTQGIIVIYFPEMRAAPTITLSAGWLLCSGSVSGVATLASSTTSTTHGSLLVSSATASTAYLSAYLQSDATAGRTITINAEL